MHFPFYSPYLQISYSGSILPQTYTLNITNNNNNANNIQKYTSLDRNEPAIMLSQVWLSKMCVC